MHKSGQKAPESGQYGVLGPKSGKTETEVTVTKGETLLADMTNDGVYRLLYPEGNEANLFPAISLLLVREIYQAERLSEQLIGQHYSDQDQSNRK